MKKTSIKDIAESVGVSKTLVSLVLNNKADSYGISKETQKKVLEKVKELNYKPNRLAQGLRSGKSKMIGLVVADISNPFYSKIARHIEDLVDNSGYNLIICNTDENEAKEKKMIQKLLERHVDGLIVTSTSLQNEELNKLNSEDIPLILVDRHIKEIETNYVGVDNYNGSFEAVEHLINQGHKSIALITVTPSYISSLDERKKGYLGALKKHKIEFKEQHELVIPYNNLEQEITSALKKLFDLPNKPDSLFITNYKLTIETLKNLKQLNIKIPDDISIVGFDDMPLFDIIQGPISTVAQPIPEICKSTVDLLFSIMEDTSKAKKKEQIILPTKLIIRK